MVFRFSNVTKIIKELYNLKDCLLKQSNNTTDIILSVSQCTTVTNCIHFIVLSGFIPCLITSIWSSFGNKQKNMIKVNKNISPNKVPPDILKIFKLKFLLLY